jgi:transcriptional regulator with XRE-family HTH domain
MQSQGIELQLPSRSSNFRRTCFILDAVHTPGSAQPVGELLREWRQRRRLSQLDLALEANVSSRHLSFLETGRARPSREMILLLAEQLNVPLRSRNVLLNAAGYAPIYPERTLDDPAMQAARSAVDAVLTGQEPYPALAMDRHWTILAYNRAIVPLLHGVDTELLEPPINVIRLSLHPDGLSKRIVNYRQWRAHLLERLHRQIESTADAVLRELRQEIMTYPGHDMNPSEVSTEWQHPGLTVPLQLETEQGVLGFLSTTMVFGTPLDVTLAELALELFFPADDWTASVLRASFL